MAGHQTFGWHCLSPRRRLTTCNDACNNSLWAKPNKQRRQRRLAAPSTICNQQHII